MEDEGCDRHPKRSKPTNHCQFPSTSMQESTSTIPILPEELISEILSRLPVKPLLKFRCVSKSWLSLISSTEFVNTHLSLSANKKEYTHHMLILDSNYMLRHCNLRSLFREASIRSIDTDYPTKSNGSDKMWPDFDRIIGSVNGLICLSTENDHLFMWNPSIRKYTKLPDPKPRLRKVYWRQYGFGYDEFHDDYKIVGIFFFDEYGTTNKDEIKIYSLKSDSWRSVDPCPIEDLSIDSGKFVKGKLHWLTKTPGYNFCKGGDIISLDLADEKWGKVEQPCYGEGDIELWAGVLGSDLSVFCECDGIHVDGWVMKEYGVKESWTKIFTVKYPDMAYSDLKYPMFFMSNKGEVVIVFGSTSVIYNLKNGSLRLSKVIDVVGCHEVEIYVESLVCPFSTKGIEDAAKTKGEKAQIKTIE
ncbi:hypothetical protein HAX54_011696 [Datura stramonium]|uniref:F-box domain-containing protein n=1 Tax=Datura stramonium TaxID=4076 RepID=A0ABS8RXD4_DATST|nr:hypothetical protein [Datura stramonium]